MLLFFLKIFFHFEISSVILLLLQITHAGIVDVLIMLTSNIFGLSLAAKKKRKEL